ncbi:MAG TPA: NADH-quinone oxidoreductase subunit NuoK [Chloroflexota bacterium]|jgi:NADH:ubiquinone oxidoreductase subunit K|nr:NADH-quinone oxidoreductase subunit NuoK [Chloroflexota bacterium]
MVPLEHIVVFSAIIFCIGLYGVMARRNAVLVLMAVELMLNAVAINLVAFAGRIDPQQFSGLIFAVFVITVAAAELGLGLAIVLRVYRMRTSINVDEVDALRW